MTPCKWLCTYIFTWTCQWYITTVMIWQYDSHQNKKQLLQFSHVMTQGDNTWMLQLVTKWNKIHNYTEATESLTDSPLLLTPLDSYTCLCSRVSQTFLLSEPFWLRKMTTNLCSQKHRVSGWQTSKIKNLYFGTAFR